MRSTRRLDFQSELSETPVGGKDVCIAPQVNARIHGDGVRDRARQTPRIDRNLLGLGHLRHRTAGNERTPSRSTTPSPEPREITAEVMRTDAAGRDDLRKLRPNILVGRLESIGIREAVRHDRVAEAVGSPSVPRLRSTPSIEQRRE